MKISRRSFLLSLGAAAVAAPAIASARITTFDTILERVTVVVPGLPSALDGFKIAFATDLHLSVNVPYEFLAAALSVLRAENADLMVWGGDYVAVNGSKLARVTTRLAQGKTSKTEQLSYDERVSNLAGPLAELLKIKPDAPAVGVRGNHEIWVAPKALDAAVRDSGTTLLINDNFQFSKAGHLIDVAGVDDYWNGVPTPPVFAKDAALKIFVSHNPDYVAVLEKAGLAQFHLALCGHTHGGQICLPGIGALSYNIESRFTVGLKYLGGSKYSGGDHDLTRRSGLSGSGAAIYTSRGLGVVEVPMRINCPPEITILTVKSA